MRNKIKTLYILTFFLAFMGCDDPWDSHLEKYNMDTATSSLLEIIQETPELSSFYQMIVEAELEDLFSSSITTSVWAPVNSAIGSLGTDYEGDPEGLLQFIQNHVSRGLFPLSPEKEEARLKMLNGKKVPIDMGEGLIYGEPTSGEYNRMATNGIIHLIDQAIDLRRNIWEFIEETDYNLEEINFLNSLTGERFVDSLAVQIGFDPITSEPIYDTLSGTVWYNEFVIDHKDLRNEDSLFTFLILENDVFQDQYTRFVPYLKLPSTDDRDSAVFTKYMICIDLVASGYLTPEELPGTLTSVNGIKLPFNRGAIIETIEASNGVIYRINSCDLELEAKFPPIIIEAELENKVVYTGGGKLGFTRQKPLASGGFDFVLDDHDGSPGRIIYPAGMVAATKYDFYWKAVDDFGGTYDGSAPDSLIHQKLEKVIYIEKNPIETRFPMHKSISDSLLWVVDLNYETAEERYAGSYNSLYFQDFWLQLIGSGNNTTLTLDYVKLVPVFE